MVTRLSCRYDILRPSQPSIFCYFSLLLERLEGIARELDSSVTRKNPIPTPACFTVSRFASLFLSTLYAPHSKLYALHYTLHALPSMPYAPHSTHYTLTALHSTLDSLHSILYTLRCILYTLRSTLYTLRCMLYALRYSVICAL